MKFSPRELSAVQRALRVWVSAGLLDEHQIDELVGCIKGTEWDWALLARYALWAASACLMISIGAIFADEWIWSLVRKISSAPHAVHAGVLSASSLLCLALIAYRLQKGSERTFRLEAAVFFAACLLASSIYPWKQALHMGDSYAVLFLGAAALYSAGALLLKSSTLWSFGLIASMCWWAAETGYGSGWGVHFWGMSYALRFLGWGAVTLAVISALEAIQPRHFTILSSRFSGLSSFFLSAWSLSMFGNASGALFAASKLELLVWSLFLAVASALGVLWGVRRKDDLTLGFGVVFFFLNLYTKYFEVFWNLLHKAAFFAVLAASLWGLGSCAERLLRPPRRPKLL